MKIGNGKVSGSLANWVHSKYQPRAFVPQNTHRVAMATSGVHSIMMVKSAQPGESGGCTPAPFRPIYHHEQSYGARSS
jgi:hypothetical protein